MLRKDKEKHGKEECPRRQYECPHCKEAGEYLERTTSHYVKCPKVKVQCPNRNCLVTIPRCELSEHRTTCSYENIVCKYVNIGCKCSSLRKDLAEHENDSKYHLQVAIDAVNLLQTKCSQNLVLAGKTDQPVPQTTFQFTDFLQRKTNNEKIFSPPFYTDYGGYKMCIRVDVNGCGDGKETHISVYIFLMHGENDDHLSWPFTGTVTIELLNQLRNANHHSAKSVFTDTKAGQRVVNSDRALSSCGYRTFISHSSLGYDAAKRCQYLLNDCLYFRVKVTRATTSKPWLVTASRF